MQETKKSFLLYHDYFESLSGLDDSQLGALMRAVFEYERQGITPSSLSPICAMAFSFIKSNLDRDRAHYEERCQQNALNGKKGGRPKKTEKTERFSEKPKKPDNDNGIDIENGIDMDIGGGNENEIENGIEIGGGNENGGSSSVSDGTATATTESEGKEEIRDSGEEESLLSGIPKDYIEARRERATVYGKRVGKSAAALLREWYEADRAEWERLKGSKGGSPRDRPEERLPKSYDLDDFFEAALNRTMSATPF